MRVGPFGTPVDPGGMYAGVVDSQVDRRVGDTVADVCRPRSVQGSRTSQTRLPFHEKADTSGWEHRVQHVGTTQQR